MSTVQSAGDFWRFIAATFSKGDPVSVSPTALLLILAVAVALSVPRITWKYFGYVALVVHELGHAIAALTTGQYVKGISLNRDHSGTTSTLSRGKLRTIWSAFWGYPAPAVVGAAFIWSAYAGWATAAASTTAILLVLSLVFIRNFTGIVITLAVAAAAVALAWFTPTAFIGHILVAVGIALLVAAVRDWLNVTSVHLSRRDNLQSSDAYILFRRTGIPSPIWLLGFAAAITTAGAIAASTMGFSPAAASEWLTIRR